MRRRDLQRQGFLNLYLYTFLLFLYTYYFFSAAQPDIISFFVVMLRDAFTCAIDRDNLNKREGQKDITPVVKNEITWTIKRRIISTLISILEGLYTLK